MSRSPATDSPSATSDPLSGVARGSAAAGSIGATCQKGEAGPSSAKGSSQAWRPKRDAARSSAVWSRTGKGARSGSPGCGKLRRHAFW